MQTENELLAGMGLDSASVNNSPVSRKLMDALTGIQVDNETVSRKMADMQSANSILTKENNDLRDQVAQLQAAQQISKPTVPTT